MIKEREEQVKKNSIANIIADKLSRKQDHNSSIVLQQHFTQKLRISETEEVQNLAFPRLSSNLRKKRGNRKDPRAEQS